MISSEEEFSLLLKKWCGERLQVAVLLLLDERFVMHVKGYINFAETLP